MLAIPQLSSTVYLRPSVRSSSSSSSSSSNSRTNSSSCFWLLCAALAALLPAATDAGFFDYFRPEWPTESSRTSLDTVPTVPYELAAPDEQFIRDGAKLIGAPLGQLDMCHQRVVLALRRSCADLGAEQLGKLAVMLLNCQSDSEGRPLYVCTDAMSLAQCTQPMDTDTWNAYHLITNRAKAVCASVRQDQFRGLTELTVNRLMAAARDQAALMQSVTGGQERLQAATQRSLDALGDNNERLMQQQQEMMQASDQHRAAIETNLQDLMHEKNLIKAGQLEVATMIAALKAKLDDGVATLDAHSNQAHHNHAELLSDLERLHQSAQQISVRLEHAMEYVLTQSEVAASQFDQTADRLTDIKRTVFDVAAVLAALQADLNEHLAWVTERVGGTERFVQKLQLVLQYVGYLLGGMLMLVFVGAGAFSRSVFLVGTVAGFAVNYADVCELALRDLTVGLLAVMLVNFVRRHARLPGSLSLSMAPKADGNSDQNDATALNDTAKSQTKPDYDDADDADYYQRSRASAYKTPASGRSVTPMSELRSDGFERFATRSRSGTPFSATSETRARCAAITAKGDRCRLAALLDGTRCATHNRMYER